MSFKYLHRYAAKFMGRFNDRQYHEARTDATGMAWYERQRLRYADLTAE